MAAALRAMLAAAAFAIPAYAQVLTGTVRDSVAHLPLPGVVVALLDSSGAAVTRTLTNERGEYRALLTGPVRTVRAIRIGYGARALPIPPRTTGNVQIDFSLLALPTMIQAVHVLGDTRCPDRNDRAAAFGLWEQARAGLLATVVARETNPGSMVRLLFTRKYEPIENGRDRNRIASMTVRADSSVSTASFVAAHSVQDFVASGFASLGERVRTYFGPDAELLLSEQFATAYCLELSDSRPRAKESGWCSVSPGVSARWHDQHRWHAVDRHALARTSRSGLLISGSPYRRGAIAPSGRLRVVPHNEEWRTAGR